MNDEQLEQIYQLCKSIYNEKMAGLDKNDPPSKLSADSNLTGCVGYVGRCGPDATETMKSSMTMFNDLISGLITTDEILTMKALYNTIEHSQRIRLNGIEVKHEGEVFAILLPLVPIDGVLCYRHKSGRWCEFNRYDMGHDKPVIAVLKNDAIYFCDKDLDVEVAKILLDEKLLIPHAVFHDAMDEAKKIINDDDDGEYAALDLYCDESTSVMKRFTQELLSDETYGINDDKREKVEALLRLFYAGRWTPWLTGPQGAMGMSGLAATDPVDIYEHAILVAELAQTQGRDKAIEAIRKSMQ